jgi:two-component system, cell cycle response regulator DivK
MVNPSTPRRPAVVLVVEDSEEAYELLSDVLADADFEVVGAQNGIDAVDTAVKLLPDLILMDLSLPLMGGCEATRLLKIDERTRNIPIIALTGHHNYAEMAKQAGCDAFFTKPCPPEKLLAEIDRILGIEHRDITPRAVRVSERN